MRSGGVLVLVVILQRGDFTAHDVLMVENFDAMTSFLKPTVHVRIYRHCTLLAASYTIIINYACLITIVQPLIHSVCPIKQCSKIYAIMHVHVSMYIRIQKYWLTFLPVLKPLVGDWSL